MMDPFLKSDYNKINLNFVPINVLQQVLERVRLSKSVSNQLKAEYQDPIYICELTKDITRWAVMLRPCDGPGKFSNFTVEISNFTVVSNYSRGSGTA